MKKLGLILIALVLVISCAACANDVETITWDDIVLGDMLPVPSSDKGEVHTNAADHLWMDIEGLSEKQFSDYIEECKVKGFTVDAKYNSTSYEAYNGEGYKLTLRHYASLEETSIELEAPIEMSTITWPASAAGEQLPIPKSTIGKFSYEYSDHFFVYIGNTTREEYAEYVNACVEKGFNVDYSKGDDYYRADNVEGWHISVSYQGNNIMSIDIDAPEDESDNEITIPTTEAKTDSVGLDPEFKAAMDSYEEFMDEYVAFMKKYKENPTDQGLLADYAKIMGQYADFTENFAKWEDEEMNAAETAYYIEVQSRVTKKLLEVAN